jgi:hypothetical protein
VERQRDGARVIAVEFIGQAPPPSYLERPWALFQVKKWNGVERRRESRVQGKEPVTVEFLDESMQPIKQEIVTLEDRSRGGCRVRLAQSPPEFDMLRVIDAVPGVEYLAVVSNQFVGKDGYERLCLRFTQPSLATSASAGLPS